MARNTNQNFSQDRLRKYYKKEGISALNFNCKFYENCRSNCENKRKFVKAREPYIGPKYGKKKIPRLLFLSLDPGWSPILSKKRTIQYMRKSHLAFHRSEIPKGRHWYVTHQFTWIILDEFSKNSDSKLDIGLTNKLIHFDPKREIHKIMPYFAHTNSAKCCENNENSKLANKSMFKNCRAFIPGEVKIFDPHILVTQGQYAQRAIEEAINKGSFTVKEKGIYLRRVCKNRILWLWRSMKISLLYGYIITIQAITELLRKIAINLELMQKKQLNF